MERRYIHSPSWVFSFAGTEFFVTTFAPCYPHDSSRYQFGVADAAFVLLQPYHSFMLHRVGVQTPRSHTFPNSGSSNGSSNGSSGNANNGGDVQQRQLDVRDEIRLRFARHGRPYFVPEHPTRMSNAYDVVPPRTEHSTVVRWWRDDNCTTSTTLAQLESNNWPLS